ncbi:4'-phosphopantetheinyl transferase family protein [Streptomyces sp. NPDC059828]|uniref:4'-phosphopantetheinyl transferase family protein n=1 Tax=Streptomyces sp. NPDC059828 TaxID=3346965 RepID=UPI00364F0DF2
MTVPAHRLALLDPAERQRYERHQADGDHAARDRHATAAVLLRTLAARYAGCPAGRVRVDRTCAGCGQPHGKPQLPGLDLHVSLSHTDDLIAVAVTRAGPVGVDVERIDRGLDHRALARYALSGEETAWFRETEPVTGFYLVWTRKESILKATGDGLRVPMATLTLSAPGLPVRLLDATAHPGLPARARTTDLRPGPDHVAAVTVLADRPVRIRESDVCADWLERE